MLNKKILLGIVLSGFCTAVYAEDVAPAVANTNVPEQTLNLNEFDEGSSLFQRISDMEQEKVLMKLEMEQARMELDMDKLMSEKIRLQREMEQMQKDTEEETRKAEAEKKKIEQEKARLEQERQAFEEEKRNQINRSLSEVAVSTSTQQQVQEEVNEGEKLSDTYRVLDIYGAGNELFVTIENMKNTQKRKLQVGKQLPNGYEVKSISLDDGVTFKKGNDSQTLGVQQ